MLVGDVADVEDDARDRWIGEAVDADAVHDAPRSVGVMKPRLRRDRLTGMFAGFSQSVLDARAIVDVQKVENRPTDRLVGRPAEMPSRRGAEIGNPTFTIEQQQGVGTV